MPTLTVGQNVFIGQRLDIGTMVQRPQDRAARRARPFLEMAGVGDVDPLHSAGRLSVGEQQLVELARRSPAMRRSSSSTSPQQRSPIPRSNASFTSSKT